MRFWTTQSEKVIGIILRDGIYHPDFSLSDGLGGGGMKGGYSGILNEYRKRNVINCAGLVFGISELEDAPVLSIKQYKEYFMENPTFWDSVSHASDSYAILELEIPDKIDTIPMYFQDFIIISMRAIVDTDFKIYSKPSLANCAFQDFGKDLRIAQSEGWVAREDYFIENIMIQSLLNKITQAHFHQITLNSVKGVYETYDFDNHSSALLGANALKLRQHIGTK